MDRARGPLPPDDLLTRVGVDPALPRDVRIAQFDAVGRMGYLDILSAMPGDRSPAKVLDFGCGSGRILRWFWGSSELELTGCDIHAPTIQWMRTAYPEEVRLYVSDPSPPLPEADETFDLVYCSSVFSHLPDWAPWLIELRRVLKPGGVLVASVHGPAMWRFGVAGSRGVPWDEDRTGLLVERYGDDFDSGWGPAVYVSEWWLRAHWGRAMEILRFAPSGFALASNRSEGQAWVIARRRHGDGPLTAESLRAPSDDRRELSAALRAQWLAYEELGARG